MILLFEPLDRGIWADEPVLLHGHDTFTLALLASILTFSVTHPPGSSSTSAQCLTAPQRTVHPSDCRQKNPSPAILAGGASCKRRNVLYSYRCLTDAQSEAVLLGLSISQGFHELWWGSMSLGIITRS